ncbi:hypothetical protein TNCV_2468381 [Trichonephila clavipes]|nr:hypothetical protein TNCV_2468381 [Trichonephila clavipes]
MWFPHFRNTLRVRNMNHYLNPELADIPFIYSLANGNGVLPFGCIGKDIRRGVNRIFNVRSVRQNMDLSGPRLTTRPSILKWT